MEAWGHRALVCALVVVGCLVAVGAGAVVATDAATGQNGVAPAEDLNAADEIHVTIDLHENRSATVTVDYRYELTNNESTVDWDELEGRIESNPDAYVEVERESWQQTVERGQNETGQEMELSAFDVTTDESSTPVRLGHVRFQFEWSSFAYGEPQYLEVGDALAGFTLVDHTRLTITWPDTYNATTIQPEPSMREASAAHWDGSEVTFDDPRIELIQNGGGNGGDDGDIVWGISWQVGVAIGALGTALVAAVGIVGWLLTRGPSNGSTTGYDSVGAGNAANGSSEGPSMDLLSNEEQVVQLLRQRGGRLKQQQVVSELNWTEAKTSQVVGGLREAGEIEVFRIGRENVLVLSERDE